MKAKDSVPHWLMEEQLVCRARLVGRAPVSPPSFKHVYGLGWSMANKQFLELKGTSGGLQDFERPLPVVGRFLLRQLKWGCAFAS